MTLKMEADEAEVDVKSDGKESPKGSEQSAKTNAKSTAKRRTKTGCLTCRRRRIKCGEEKPFCKNCIKSKRECAGYVQPLVYKQQQGLSGQEAGSRSSISDGDFQFNEAFSGYTPVSQYGSFNPFLSGQEHLGHSYGFQSHVPVTAYGTPSDSFEEYRRHSFQEHNSALLGFGASTQAYGTGQDNLWVGRPHPLVTTELISPARGPMVVPSTLMTSPGAFSESYVGGSSSHFDATPLHESPRRYSIHGFVQVASRGSQFPTLGAPQDLKNSDESPGDPDETEMDDLEDDLAEPYEIRGGHPHHGKYQGVRRRFQHDGAVKIINQPTPTSPLLDEKNRQVFTHFMNVLAPCMSTFERPSLDIWATTPRTVWSHILPSAAMSDHALAHAMLATAGLHIAKLQQSSESVSLKHFTYAARRVGRLLSQPQRRHDVTTLATVLLLGYYEVLNSDHSRWSLHLAGATKLVTEHDLTGFTYRARRTRRRTLQLLASHPHPAALSNQECMAFGIAPSLLRDIDWDVDMQLIANLTGIAPKYDTPDSGANDGNECSDMTEDEVIHYRTKMDLWWWFCKQDMFQSMVSGERLLMPYRQRLQCPPRGRIGIAELSYATFDHLVLILSRLTDFGGKDRHRKQRVIESRGGQWVPPGWLFGRHATNTAPGPPKRDLNETSSPDNTKERTDPENRSAPPTSQRPRAPSANEGRTRQSKPEQTRREPPAMYGMMPPPALPPKMHSSFHAMERSLRNGAAASPNESNSPPHRDLDEETNAAHMEHAAISEAFDMFHASLGPELQPLPYEGAQSSSPFGPKIRYASPEIACLWAHYHIGRILLRRLHPEMPPAAMVAAGVTAHLTRADAQAIGQITAGLLASVPAGSAQEPLSPRYAATLMEISFAILFSGVQYTEMSQRGWIISKLHDIAQMTGWSTSAAVAAACEVSWERMGQAGKAPPYVRSLDRNNKDDRVNGQLRRLAPMLAASVTDGASERNAQLLGHDRDLISKSNSSRVHWAMGLLSVEEDVKNMNIGHE